MSFNYPIGKAVPPPSGGGGGWGPPPGAPSGWAPPSNAWGGGGSGGWAPPTGAWAAPTGAWAAGGGGGGGYSGGGYPPSGPVYPPSGPGSFPSQPTHPGYLPGPYPNHPPFHGGGPSAYPPAMGGPYPPGGSAYPPHGGNVYPPGNSSYLPSPSNVFPSAPHHPGYSSYPGGEQAYEPQSVSSVATGSTDAIEYFRAMSDKDVIPDDGRSHFLTLAGADGAIDAFELEGILNKVFLSEFKFDGFSSDMTRSLVAMRDYDISGKLGFEDFRRLWTDLAWCKRAFIMLDTNKSGALSKNEFAKALETMGITVTPRVHQALIMRYTDKEGNVRFDDFVLCYIRLKTMMTTYQGKDPQNTGISEFERDEFVQLAIYS